VSLASEVKDNLLQHKSYTVDAVFCFFLSGLFNRKKKDCVNQSILKTTEALLGHAP